MAGFSLSLSLGLSPRRAGSAIAAFAARLMESGSYLMMESGSKLLLEGGTSYALLHGGGWARTDTSFLSGKTVKNVKTDFGADNLAGDGSDETTKMNTILTGASVNDALYFPAGIYAYSTKFNIVGKTGIVIYGDGPSLTELRALDKTSSTLNLENCTNSRVCDLSLKVPSGSVRNSIGNSNRGVMLYNSTGIRLNNVEVFGPENGGIFIEGGSRDIRVTYCYVNQNWADNIHITGASRDVTVQYCKTYKGGDDSYASIGYGSALNYNINFLDNISIESGATGDTGGSGLSFEGTIGGTASGNRIYLSKVAGIRIDTPTSFGIGNTDIIDVRHNYFEGCRTNTAVAHAAVMIFAGSAYVRGVTFSNNTIVNPNTATGIKVFGTSASLNVVAQINNNMMLNTTGLMTTGFDIDATYATVSKSGNTLNGVAV